MLLCLYIPTLQNYDLAVFAGAHLSWRVEDRIAPWSLHREPDVRNLQSLKLRRGPGCELTLWVILKHSPRLRNLELDFDMPSSRRPMGLNDLSEALAFVSKTLEPLTIRYDVFSDQEDVNAEGLYEILDGVMDPFSNFERLSFLEIPLAILLGVDPPMLWQADHPTLADRLPGSLTQLVLVDDVFGLEPFSWELADLLSCMGEYFGDDDCVDPGWKAATPSLKRFVLDMSSGRPLYDVFELRPGSRQKLRETCRAEGIDCQVLLKE